MKKIFRKNQVVITALAIMIAVAGYLNFTDDQQALNTSVGNMKNEGAEGNSDDDTISASVNDTVDDGVFANLMDGSENLEDVDAPVSGDAEAVSAETDSLEEGEVNDLDSEEVAENESDPENSEDNTDVAEVSVDENGEPIDSETVGEAVLTSASVTLSEAKLNREQTRSKAKEMLLEIINNENLSEDSKQDAIDKMLSLTERMEKETAAETQLAAKGFTDAIVSISDDSVDVTVSIDSLTDTQRAQIEDIIMRKTGCELTQIVITTTNM